ncbi:MAG: hypothetical protein M3Q56_10680 [Bacteroidota bacterium]|nr:hypothetical protein [Bacteroidota bacterium]
MSLVTYCFASKGKNPLISQALFKRDLIGKFISVVTNISSTVLPGIFSASSDL